jgi:hypothetical protein
MAEDVEIRYPDSVRIAGGRLVRVNSMNPESTVTLAGPGNHKMKVKDIQDRMTAAVLACGTPIRGILLEKNKLVFCEVHGKLERIAQITA